VDPVAAAPVITTDVNISSLTAAQYENKSVLIRGARVYVTVPLTLKDLMLIDGAILSVSEETKLDLIITDRVFVDGDSRVDVSGKGWLGGLAKREDNSFTNSSRSGRTIGAAAGATNASASHAGIGGAYQGITNAVYGSITDPVDFGAGGAAALAGTAAGGNGGGLLRLIGGAGLSRFVFAGSVLANGSTGAAAAGAGGSIDLRCRALITSPITVIAANGGDDDALANFDMGGGGGRVAIRTSERLDAQPTQFIARGGRNGTTAEGMQFVDGGAGTVYLVSPDGSRSLRVSSHDDRYPTSTHRVMGTPLSATPADSIHIGPRALAVFDQAPVTVPIVDPTAQIAQPGDQPAVTLRSTVPAANGSIAQNTSVVATYDAASLVGIREVRTILSAQPVDAVSYLQFATSVTGSTISTTVPSTASAGNATMKLLLRDRAGRVAETAVIPFTVVTNTAPVIDTFDVTPATESYAGRSLAVSASASDDIAVQSLTLSASVGTVTANPTATPTPSTMSRSFSVALPPTATPGGNVVLTLSALDDFPGRIATTATKSINILHDALAPSMTVVKPAANEQFNEGTGATFAVEVNASDAEVAVKNVSATFEGVDTALTFSNGLWRTTLNVPNVEGTDPVAKPLVIKAFDYENNVATTNLTVYIKPLLDPNAPALSWVCSSPGSMAPVGVATSFRILAVPSGGTNGVQSVTFQFGTNAPVTATNAGANQYTSAFTIPAGTADGTEFPVRVTARSVGGNESTLLGTLTAITGLTINTASTIAAGDLAFEDQSFIVVSGGTLTVIGPHRFKNVAILAGGTLVQKHTNPYSADLVEVQRLSVACGGLFDVTALGLARNSSFPGSGAADYLSGGSHLGRGGISWRNPAGVFGSVFEPRTPGAGGHSAALTVPPAAAGSGGGMVRVRAAGNVVVDGSIVARGQVGQSAGGGAGGSIWLETAGALNGGGSLDVSGASAMHGGGGGAIAVRATSFAPSLRAIAKGGDGSQLRPGAAGTIAWNDDVTIDNSGLTTLMPTELPAFGRAVVTSIVADEVLLDRRFVSSSLTGHRVRGSSGGTYRIASITNDIVTYDGAMTIGIQDSVSYDGWLMFSGQGVGIERRKLVAVRRFSGSWQYDTDTSFSTFTPNGDDLLFATFSKNGQRITRVEKLTCANACPTIDGIATAEMVSGELTPNTSMLSQNGPLTFLNAPDAAEIFVRPDIDRRAFTLARGGSSRVRLEALPGTTGLPAINETLRGTYQFNTLKLTNAKVVTEDLLEVLGTLTKDATSSLSTGNPSVPLVDPGKLSIVAGKRGAVVVGVAGAVIDPDQPLEIVATNRSGSAVKPIVLEARNLVGQGTVGGLSVRHTFGSSPTEGANAMQAITTTGYLAFSGSAATNIQVSLAPAHTTDAYAEPGHNSFRLKVNGTYEIWANATSTGKTGAYDAATAFRLEKTASALRWFVDDIEVHAVTAALPPSLVLDLSFEQSTTGEVTSIEYSPTDLPRNSFHARVAADGSFRVPIDGTAGDSIEVYARDRHTFSLSSSPVSAGLLPNVGIASLTVTPTEVSGGTQAMGTVTLLAPAGSEGADVLLLSAGPTAVVPAKVTVPAGTTSATFAIATLDVASPTDVVITAAYMGSRSSTLRIVRDTTPPSISVQAPVAGTTVNEGPGNLISVAATASDAQSGVKRVYATFDGKNYELVNGGTAWTAQIPAPYVDGPSDVPYGLVVTAVDNKDNSSATPAIQLFVRPLVDSSKPSVAWTCLSSGALFPVNHTTTVDVRAVPPSGSNLVQKVEVVVSGSTSTSVLASSLGGDLYRATITIPDVADRAIVTLRALATTVSGSTAEATVTAGAVRNATEIRTNRNLWSSDTSLDGMSVVVLDGAILQIDGARTFDRVLVLRGTIAPLSTSRLDLVSESIYVGCGSSIDSSGRGYAAGYTLNGKPHADGASHIGRSGNSIARATYGLIDRPTEAGAGASVEGGGAIRLRTSQSLTVDGSITADGASNTANGGAGGSIWIETQTVRGGGLISASGKSQCIGAGGGAVALVYTDPASTLPDLMASAGDSACNSPAGPGVIFTKGPSSTHGDVLVDGRGLARGTTELPVIGEGYIWGGGLYSYVTASVNVPVGSFLRITDRVGTLKGSWRKSLTGLEGTSLGSFADFDRWRGLYRFDTLTLRNVRLVTGDLLEYGTLNQDATSTLVQNSRPTLDVSKVTLNSTSSSINIIGAASAVTDANKPLLLEAYNDRTWEYSSYSENSNGSFSIPVTGDVGDTFSLYATDSHEFPLTSWELQVPGAVVETASVAALDLASNVVPETSRVLATVILTAPARAGGVRVALSSDSAAAALPATVIVPEGSLAASFEILANAQGRATIRATLLNTVATPLEIRSSATGLMSFVVSPSPVSGRQPATGTVTLGAPAPVGGATIALQSFNTLRAVVPASVIVPAGMTTASFAISTTPGPAEWIDILASWDVEQWALAEIAPCGAMGTAPPVASSPATIWFDDGVPPGAAATGAASFDVSQAARGSQSIHFASAAGARRWSFTGGAPLVAGPNDVLVLHALVNPCDPPRQILITWAGGAVIPVSWGDDLMNGTIQTRRGLVPTDGTWEVWSIPVREFGITTPTSFTDLTIDVFDGEAWFDLGGLAACAAPRAQAPLVVPGDIQWFDDTLPADAVEDSPVGEVIPWSWGSTQAARGAKSNLISSGSSVVRQGFTGTSETLRVGSGDLLYAYVLLDPCAPPRAVSLSWRAGSALYTGYWGDATVPGSGGRRIGTLPRAGVWSRLEVPASLLGVEDLTINGLSIAIDGGAAFLDTFGRAPRRNLALGRPAAQATTVDSAAYAVDGDIRTASETTATPAAWWDLDLGSVQLLDTIEIFPRTDCCAPQRSNFWVLVSWDPVSGNSPAEAMQNGAFGAHHPGTSFGPAIVRPRTWGRYVRIQAEGSSGLILSEVRVFGSAMRRADNWAFGSRSTAQSSTLSASTAARNAINGDVSSIGTQTFSLAQTSATANQYWDIDLGGYFMVGTINLFNRTDSAASAAAMNSFFVFTTEDGFTSTDAAVTRTQSRVSPFFLGAARNTWSIPVGRYVRFIRVQNPGNTGIALTEVEVLGVPPAGMQTHTENVQ
jgi:hypothetical protein